MQRRILMAAIFSLSLLTCFGLPSNTGSMAAMYARQSTSRLTPQEIVGQLAELAATREVFKPMAPGRAESNEYTEW
jgi:hypothetical protein